MLWITFSKPWKFRFFSSLDQTISWWTSPHLLAENSFASSEIDQGFLFRWFWCQKYVIKGLYWTVEDQFCKDLQDPLWKFSALTVKEQGRLAGPAVGTWHFCSSFYKELERWTGLPRRHRAAELLGWLHVPGWGTEQELNKLNKEFLSSLFSNLMMNKDLQLQILWTGEHGNRSREKYNAFCTSGTSGNPRNLRTPKVNVHVSSTLFVSLPICVKGYSGPKLSLGPIREW